MVRPQLFNLLFVLLVLHNFSVLDLFYQLNDILSQPVVLVAHLVQQVYQRYLRRLGVLVRLKVYPVLLVWLNEPLLYKIFLVVLDAVGDLVEETSVFLICGQVL